MKNVIGLMLILSGVALGVYVGGYLCLIKGIIELIQSITPNVIASGIAWGLAKIVVSGLVGWISFAILAVPGVVMIQD